MELNVEILAHFLAQENAQIIFPQLQLNAKDIVEMQGSNQFLNWLQQYATGILRFKLFESHSGA